MPFHKVAEGYRFSPANTRKTVNSNSSTSFKSRAEVLAGCQLEPAAA
jgi:hypothetical protein